MPTVKRRVTSGEQAVVALDLGGTKLASAIFVGDGKPVAMRTVALERRQGAAVGGLILKEVKRLTTVAAKRGLTIRAVGTSVPGIVNKGGRVWAPNISGWDDYPLRDEIGAAFAQAKVRVSVDSDRAASIRGEMWQGAARGCRDAIFLAVGTGIGAGILADGRLLRGAHGIAGAIGWMALDRPFRREYVECGCFERHASGEGIAEQAAVLLKKHKQYRGRLRVKEGLTAHDVFEALENGDEVAEKVLMEAVAFWSMACANLVSLFNPEKIIFGGGVFGPASQFLDAIATEARRWAQPVAMERVTFEVSQLGGDAALYGAAHLALRVEEPTQTAKDRMYNKNFVLAAACLGMLLFGVVFLALGSVNNMLSARFGLSNSDIGTLAALLPFGILVGSLVFGPVVDRFGYRWMLVGAALVVGGALEGLAFAGSERLVQLFMFLIGFGGGILNGATNALVADVSEGERSAKLSLLGMFFGIGALSLPSALAILSRSFSLTSIVAGIGALVIVPVVFCLAIRFPPPKQQSGRLSPGKGIRLLRDPLFLFASLALAIQSGMEGMSNDWMTRYFHNVTLSGEQSAEWKTQLGLVAVTGALVLTRLALSRLLKRIASPIVLFASVAVAATGATMLLFTPGYFLSLAACVLIGAGLAGTFPIVLGFIGDAYPRQSGTAFSTVFVIALVGNMTINKTFGYIAEAHGIQRYAVMLLCLLACSAILLFLVIWHLNRAILNRES